MTTLERASAGVLTAVDYPWISTPADPTTPEEHIYNSGKLIERTSKFIQNDEVLDLVNWGAGPKTARSGLSDKEFAADVGTFGIFVAISPADLDLYRALLPEHFSLPSEPVVSLVNVDYNQPNPIVRYKEGMVLLKAVAVNGVETWYCHSMPVETWLMMVMGHAWGFRKQLFDMTITRGKTTVLDKDGALYMELESTSSEWSDEADAIVPAGSIGGINDMSVICPKNTDLVLQFASESEAYILDEDRRMVRISVNRNLDWAGLIPEGAVAPGAYRRFVRAGGNSYIRKIR